MKKNKYFLEIAIFVCGGVVMVFELVGSRMLGPYFGTSIFVWSSLIGVILGSLSLGYYLGGKISDNNPRYSILSLIVLLSAIFIGSSVISKDYILSLLQASFNDVRLGSFLASMLLFVPSVLLGMVSPYAAKLKLDSLSTSGATIGNLYAISTAGSIAGTFLAGFYLIPTFGTNNLIFILALALLVVSIMLAGSFIKTKLAVLLIILVGWSVVSTSTIILRKNSLIDVDTAYNRIWIYDYLDKATGRMAKVMGINNENHSSMYLDGDDLTNKYTEYYDLARHFMPGFKKTLMLGGAGYSYPKYFLNKYPEATIDVVEIDPKITQLAREYFRLKTDPRLTIYHEDGRVYLNKTEKNYDVIFGDAFSSHYSVPYQLTTKEAVQKSYNSLNDDGVVVLNIISAINGERGQFLRAEYATYKSVFPQVYIFQVNQPGAGEKVQNTILIALKTKIQPSFKSSDERLNQFLQTRWLAPIENDVPILTDDFAPVDYYISKAI